MCTEFDHHWGEVDDNVEAVEEATRRLAVCNMDWDRIKAKDVYVLLNSFKPTTGLVKSVKVLVMAVLLIFDLSFLNHQTVLETSFAHFCVHLNKHFHGT